MEKLISKYCTFPLRRHIVIIWIIKFTHQVALRVNITFKRDCFWYLANVFVFSFGREVLLFPLWPNPKLWESVCSTCRIQETQDKESQITWWVIQRSQSKALLVLRVVGWVGVMFCIKTYIVDKIGLLLYWYSLLSFYSVVFFFHWYSLMSFYSIIFFFSVRKIIYERKQRIFNAFHYWTQNQVRKVARPVKTASVSVPGNVRKNNQLKHVSL